MITSTIGSFFDNLATKSRNPFLGTFVIVWLCRNWEVIFALFHFDDAMTLTDKIQFLSDRVKYETFWSELGWNIVWTFFVLLLTYILINATRYITNIFENRITPRINEWSNPKRIVSHELYIGELKKNDQLENRLEQERDDKLKARMEIEKYPFGLERV